METSTTIGRGTYSPEDNKLRIYPDARIDEETAVRLKHCGYRWAPGQKLWVAPAWTPDREDLLIELCGAVEDESTSLAERAEQRAERFSEYSENRTADAAEANQKADRIASLRPMGQPILVGHHSEGRARRDLERVQENTRKAVKFWDQAEYWKRRAAAAVRHASYKSEPAVRARRIKELEKQLRAQRTCSEDIGIHLRAFENRTDQESLKRYCVAVIRSVGVLPKKDGDHPPHGSGPDLHDLLSPGSIASQNGWYAPRDWETEIKPFIVSHLHRHLERAQRWIEHYEYRLSFELEMLAADGGIPADSAPLEVGGGIKHRFSPDGGFDKIVKVNKSTVFVVSRIGGKPWGHKICKTKIQAVLTKAQVDELRASGGIVEDDHTFTLIPVKA